MDFRFVRLCLLSKSVEEDLNSAYLALSLSALSLSLKWTLNSLSYHISLSLL